MSKHIASAGTSTREHNEFWTFRLPTTLSERVTKDASRVGQSISQYIRTALMEKTTRGVAR